MNGGLQRQGTGDADTLALAAGELVRITIDERRIETHDLRAGTRRAPARPAHAPYCGSTGLADDLTDRHARIQARIGILEDHLHAPPHLAQILTLERDQVLAVKIDVTGSRPVKLQNRPSGGGFAAARFADQTKRFAALNIEVETIDRVDGANLALDQDATRDGEMLDQVIDLENDISDRCFRYQAYKWPPSHHAHGGDTRRYSGPTLALLRNALSRFSCL